MRISGLAFIAMLVGLGAAQAQEAAQPPADPAVQAELGEALQNAERLVGENKPAEAVEALEEAIYTLSEAMPLTVRHVELVDSAEAYGQYTPRENNVFEPTDTVTLYVEPLGYTYAEEGDEYSIALDGDFEMRTPNGQVIVAQDDFARFAFTGKRRNREFYLTINYAFRNLQPGDYVLVTTLRDGPSGKSTSFETPIVVEGEPEPEAPAAGTPAAGAPEAPAPAGEGTPEPTPQQ